EGWRIAPCTRFHIGSGRKPFRAVQEAPVVKRRPALFVVTGGALPSGGRLPRRSVHRTPEYAFANPVARGSFSAWKREADVPLRKGSWPAWRTDPLHPDTESEHAAGAGAATRG